MQIIKLTRVSGYTSYGEAIINDGDGKSWRLNPQRLNPQRLNPQRLNPQRLNPQDLHRKGKGLGHTTPEGLPAGGKPFFQHHQKAQQ